MAKKKVKFFIETKDQQAQMPVGGEFPKTGFIAGWLAEVRLQVGWCALDIEQCAADVAGDMANISPLSEKEIGSVDGYELVRTSRAGNFSYYYEDRDAPLALCEILDREEPKPTYPWNAQQVWQFRSPLTDVLSLTDEAKEKFNSDTQVYEVPITTMGAKKNRHKFHLMALPSFVSAYGQAIGLDVPEFDVSALTVPDEKLVVTDEFQADLVGNGDIGYVNSLYWKQRAELWAALGEDNPEKWHTIEQASKFSTESEELSELLNAVMAGWDTPVYARLIPVPDPFVDAKYKNSNGEWVRPGVLVITEVYANKKAAVAAVEAEREARGQEEAVASDGSLQVPDLWKEYIDTESGWKEHVALMKEAVKDVPPPMLDAKLHEAIEGLGYDLINLDNNGRGPEFEMLKAWVVAE